MCRSKLEGGRRCPYHSSPEYREKENARRRLQYAKSRRAPLSDVLYNRHLEFAYQLTEKLTHDGVSTVNMYAKRNSNGQLVWNDERLAQHKEIVEHFLNKWENVPRERKAIMSGGLAGGGKTSTLTNHAGIDMSQYAMLSPDDIKELMAEKGMFPDINGLTPMESSALGYEEATHLTNILLDHTTREGYNIIYDTTMGSIPATVSKLQPMKDAGYTIKAIFVDIEVDTSLRRSQERHRRGLNEFLTEGKGYGGRLLPRSAVTNQRTDKPGFSSKNREVFEILKGENWFADTIVFDNNVDGREPVRVN